MKKEIVIFLLFILFLIPSNTLSLSLNCRNCILIDSDSERILYEKDINTSHLIAPTTILWIL